VAGATPLNLAGPRYSADIDVFHDREERVATAAIGDAALLEASGFEVRWLRQLPLVYVAEVSGPNGSTRLEWLADSDFRFFPAIPDQTFGYVLHPVDLAMNKAMAAAGRREVRDLVDLVTVHRTILPLGAVIWAAVEKSPGFTPEGLIAEIRRNSQHPEAEWRNVASAEPFDPRSVTAELRAALDQAESFVSQMPTDKLGLLFLERGKVVQPDPTQIGKYQTHSGRRRGHWPSSLEISSAMMDTYRDKRNAS
jgi:hypothetical protein